MNLTPTQKEQNASAQIVAIRHIISTLREYFAKHHSMIIRGTVLMLLDAIETLLTSLELFPRAMRLIMTRTPFLVVKHDEPYATLVYWLIRRDQMRQRTWSAKDEIAFREFLDGVDDGITAAGLTVDDPLVGLAAEMHYVNSSDLRDLLDKCVRNAEGGFVIPKYLADELTTYSTASFDSLPVAVLSKCVVDADNIFATLENARVAREM